MKSCKNCRFYDGQTCSINNAKHSPSFSCGNFVQYQG